MKINSFCVKITIAKTDGTALRLEVDPTDEYIGGGGCATLAVNLKKLFSINKVDELLTFLTDSIVFEDADLIFEEFDFDHPKYDVKTIRQLLDVCEEEYFSKMVNDIDRFCADVNDSVSSVSEIASITVENTHKATGEFSDLLEGYAEKIGLYLPDESASWLEGKTFVITGKLEHFKNQDALVAYIEGNAGSVTSNVSKNTDYLISNDISSTTSKSKKAKELGIPIINEATFLHMANGNAADALREQLTKESSIEALLDCIKECYEPSDFEGSVIHVFDMDTMTVTRKIALTINN